MTLVLRDEITGKSTRVTKVQKLFEDGNCIRVYFKNDGGEIDWTSYVFSTVVSVDEQEFWE